MAAVALCGSHGAAQPSATSQAGQLVDVKVPAPALATNLLGDAAEVRVGAARRSLKKVAEKGVGLHLRFCHDPPDEPAASWQKLTTEARPGVQNPK
ncbi:MAG: hypothetical protein ACT4QD_06985 [Acidobacteriota bacterium]